LGTLVVDPPPEPILVRSVQQFWRSSIFFKKCLNSVSPSIEEFWNLHHLE